MLDMLCLTGQVGWSRLSPPRPTERRPALRVALFLREHADAWHALRFADAAARDAIEQRPGRDAPTRADALRSSGASFLRDLSRGAARSTQAASRTPSRRSAARVSSPPTASPAFARVVRALKQQPRAIRSPARPDRPLVGAAPDVAGRSRDAPSKRRRGRCSSATASCSAGCSRARRTRRPGAS